MNQLIYYWPFGGYTKDAYISLLQAIIDYEIFMPLRELWQHYSTISELQSKALNVTVPNPYLKPTYTRVTLSRQNFQYTL